MNRISAARATAVGVSTVSLVSVMLSVTTLPAYMIETQIHLSTMSSVNAITENITETNETVDAPIAPPQTSEFQHISNASKKSIRLEV